MPKNAFRLASALVVLLIVAAPLVAYRGVRAADVVNRRISLSDTTVSANTSHQIRFSYVTAAITGSIEFEYCSNSPLLGDPCTAPSGLSLNGAVLSSESGETGFSIHANSSANRLVLTRTAVAVTPGVSQYLITGVINPDTTGSYYMRIGTFASVDGTGPRIDSGGLAFSINDPLDVAAYVPPFLLFCLGTSIPTNNCSSATGDLIDFGEFNDQTTSYATTQMIAATNGVGGYSITAVGTTMTSGNNEIATSPDPVSSQVGVSMFGINLMNNTTPNVGSAVSGAGVGLPTNDYNNTNQYMYEDGGVVARATSSTDINKFTTSYIVNINEDQAPGVYSTTITYTALASY